jgi:hypothetical protein
MTLLLCREATDNQPEDADTFQGGYPKLPEGTTRPTCSKCQADLTFFFQVAFPATHPWREHSIEGQLAAAEIPDDFLGRYATNFRTIVFETKAGRVQRLYPARVQFAMLVPCERPKTALAQVGGNPVWVLENESPIKVAGSSAAFLFQLRQGLEFQTVDGAPPQMDVALDGSLQPRSPGKYQLFLANEVYFFGPTEPNSLVYILTQVD